MVRSAFSTKWDASLPSHARNAGVERRLNRGGRTFCVERLEDRITGTREDIGAFSLQADNDRIIGETDLWIVWFATYSDGGGYES